MANKEGEVKSRSANRSSPRAKRSSSVSGSDFPIIGVGASAGGLEAFGKLLSNMPADTGMAFVLIQHLDPSHTSNMVELLKRYTKMPVREATDDTPLQPDTVYMIPPNRNMSIVDKTLKLAEQHEHPGIIHSIDLFFRSLASDLKEKAICIILSGTGSDGTLGAKAVKAELGMVMVQDPETAAYDGMPRAAITSGVADFILPAEAMPKFLLEYIERSWGKRAMRRREVERDSSSLNTILSLIRARTKHDFSGYKQSTIHRRIERRMGINKIDNISEYLKYLREHPAEVDALVKDFLINVTSFFRDPDAFAAFKASLRKFLDEKPDGSEVRAWIPGCSTGEEAYSVAMVLEEVQEEVKKYFRIQVFGTDLDPDAIAAARSGLYPPSVAGDITEERVKRFFTRHDEQLQVKRELREKLVFAVQDVIADPPFTKMDVISARNLLIYFDADLQKRLIPMFHYALKEGGLLFLGTAETVGGFAELFSVVDRRWKIYRAEASSKQPPLQAVAQPSWREPGLMLPREAATRPARPRTAEEMLLEALPPSVLVDANYQVVYAHGVLRKYLGVPQGKPNMDVLDMVHPELRSYLASAIREASAKRSEVVVEGGPVKLNGETQPVRLTVRPVASGPGEPSGQMIITFQDMPKPKRRSKGKGAEDARVIALEQELQLTKETLRSTIEELETANEELRSANEEYQSTNEELQSTNEELETSREELQSVNEELTTVNTEHQAKIEELSTVNDDMKNLLNSTGIAVIYLDNELKIKRFTPAATTIFNLISSDVDRPISHITSQIGNDTLPEQAKQVLDTLIPREQEIQAKDGRWYTMRMIPYRTTDNSIAGVVVTFINISDQARIREDLKVARAIIESLFHPVLLLDQSLKIMFANRAFYRMFALEPADIESKTLRDVGEGWDDAQLKRLLEEVIRKNTEFEGYVIEAKAGQAGSRKLCLNARQVAGDQRQLLMTIEDVTEGPVKFCTRQN